MTRTLNVAALQLSFAKGDLAENISRVAAAVRNAAAQGAEEGQPPARQMRTAQSI